MRHCIERSNTSLGTRSSLATDQAAAPPCDEHRPPHGGVTAIMVNSISLVYRAPSFLLPSGSMRASGIDSCGLLHTLPCKPTIPARNANASPGPIGPNNRCSFGGEAQRHMPAMYGNCSLSIGAGELLQHKCKNAND